MKKFLQYTICIFLCFYKVTTALGQGFSVQPTIQLFPPYSVYLSDYVSPTNSKLSVSIFAKDINSDYRVKLKFIIKGDGITIESKPNVPAIPININSPVEILSGADLAVYLDPANLNFYGLNKDQFMKTGKLPEGIYQFGVQVLEYNRSVPVSDISFVPAWLVLNDPPRWIIPEQNARVKALEPQNLLLSWLPMHTGSPNSAFSTEYEFTLVEIWPSNRNPNDAINVGSPLLRTTTGNPSLILTPADPPLVIGRRYACRVRAYDKEGRDLFKNQGYSEVLTFTYGDVCLFPVNIQAKPQGFESARLSWTSSIGNTEYKVRYRGKNPGIQSAWFDTTTSQNYLILENLGSGLYEYAISSTCGELIGNYTPPDTFSIAPRQNSKFDCNQNNYNEYSSDNSVRTDLRTGEIIKVAGFEVKVTQISGTDGVYSGKGFVVVPFMNNAKLATNIEGVKVNQSNKVIAGNITLESASFQVLDDKTRDQITELLQTVTQKTDDINSILQNSDKIITQADMLLATVKDIPEATKKLIADGKAMIQKGKQDMQAGDTEEGKSLFEKGKQAIKDGITAIMKGSSNGGSDSEDSNNNDLKELISKILNSMKAEKDGDISKIKSEAASKNKDKLSAKNKINDRNKAVGIGDYKAISMSEVYVVGDIIPINYSSEEQSQILKDDNYKNYFQSSSLSDAQIEKLIKSIEIIVVTSYLLKEDNLNLLVKEVSDNLMGDVKKISEDLIKDTLKGKKTDLEKTLNTYLENKVQNLISEMSK